MDEPQQPSDDKKRWAQTGKRVIRGAAHHEISRIGQRLDDSTAGFKEEVAARFEHWATDIRELGKRFNCPEEGAAIARRMEKTADYLMFRPSTLVAEDAWTTLRNSRVLWVAGGLLAGVIAYRIVRSSRDPETDEL